MNLLFSSYKNYKSTEVFDTIIIGSGISGLAMSSLLSKEGQKVVLLEQHYTPGGMTHTFKRNKYEWDVGLHYVGDVGKSSQLKKVFDYICDTPIEWADMGEVYDCAYFGNEKFEFRKGRKQFTEYFTKLFPDEKKAIEIYIELIISMGGFGMNYYAEKVIPNFISKLFGKWMRKKYLKYALRTTKDVIDELFNNNKLKAILTSQFGDIGLTPTKSSFAIHAAIVNHYLNGGYYPVGGPGVIFEKIAPIIKKAGGEILVRAEVSEILVENGVVKGVRMSDGKTIYANTVVSTVGIDITYRKLLSVKAQDKIGFSKLLTGLHHSTSYYCLYLGLKGKSKELNLPKSNFWIFPEKFDHDKNLYDYVNGKTNKLPVVYISFPAAKDPDFENRFPDKCTIEIIALTSYNKFNPEKNQKWQHRTEEYDNLKETLSNELLTYLYKYLPQTEGKIDYQELSTPLSVNHFTGHAYGELYGLDHTTKRFNSRILKPKTAIKGLYLAGQDIVTAGIAGGLMSSVICMSHMKRSNYLKKIMKS